MSSKETNGASLEDCQTNVFVLTELNGLKWKKFVTPIDQGSRGCSEVGDDPILRAYGRCLSDGLLAVWRRAPARDRATATGQVDLRLAAEKELWVFWYQEEPELLKSATSNLTNPDVGGTLPCGDSGIDYETRVLLFKALHNLIERFLIQKGFVRLGRFFVQPLDPDTVLGDQSPPPYVLGFYLTFLVHGDNNVCVSVNTQRQPAVYRLAKRHLTQPMNQGGKQSVVLAPWCISANINTASPFSNHLLGESAPTESGGSVPTSELHSRIRRSEGQWKEWSSFYPLPTDNIENLGYVDPVEKERQEKAKAMALPKMVEVTVAGVRMYYPSCMVMVLASEDAKVMGAGSNVESPNCKTPTSSSPQKTPQSPCSPPVCRAPPVSGCAVAGHAAQELFVTGRRVPPVVTPQSVSSFDGTISDSTNNQPCTSDDPRWDFEDPCEKGKQMCGCRAMSSQRPVLNKAQQKFFDRTSSRQSALFNIINAPFHRRSPLPPPPQNHSHPLPPPLPSVSLNVATGLPPHEPVVQMISPVPPAATPCGTGPHCTMTPVPSLLSFNPLPVRPLDPRIGRPSLQPAPNLKKPKLDSLDRFCVSKLIGENLDLEPLIDNWFGRSSHPWLPKLQSFESDIMVKTEPTSGEPLNQLVVGDADILLPDKCLPEDFLLCGDIKTQCSSPETKHNDIGLMSPPASNEHAGRMPPPAVPMGGKGGGPPSNEYIYPTPPSLEPNVNAQQWSPESLHHKPLLNMSPVVSWSSGDCNRSTLVATPPALLNSTITCMSVPLCYDNTGGVEGGTAPGIAKYYSSSKYFGPIQSRRKRGGDMVHSPDYKPSIVVPRPVPKCMPGVHTMHVSRHVSTPMGSPSVCKTGGMTDLQSPLSNAPSTPYNRTLNSVEQMAALNSCSVGPPGLNVPEAHSLVLTLLLSDTFVDLHRDASFDSCPLCACELNNLNILGEEAGVYVPTLPSAYPNVPSHGGTHRCSCGFSAVRYRYLSSEAGLFEEDERDATPFGRHMPLQLAPLAEHLDCDLIELIRVYSLVHDIAPQVSQPYKLYQLCDVDNPESGWKGEYCTSALEKEDLSQLCNSGMEAACMVMDCTTPSKGDFEKTKSEVIESWGFLRAVHQSEASDWEALSLIESLLPILQESLTKPRGVNAPVQTEVTGPLTWRNLERKCIRTNKQEDACQPEPVPRVVVTMDKEYVTVSPMALKLWDRLLLEPHCQPKDVLFVGLIPDIPLVGTRARSFFRELSKVYENMRFGRHIPYTKVHADGLVRVGNELLRRLHANELDGWFDLALSNKLSPEMLACIKSYALMCRQYMSSLLKGAFDRQVMRDTAKDNQRPTGSEAMPPPATPSNCASDSGDNNNNNGSDANDDVDDGYLPHTVVIYLVNPFAFGAEESSSSVARVCYLSLMRCYCELLEELGVNHRPLVHLEIVSLRDLLDATAGLSLAQPQMCNPDSGVPPVPTHSPYISWVTNPARQTAGQQSLKNLALSVLSHSRSLTAQVLMNSSQAKCLTGFGPAANRCLTMQRHIRESAADSSHRTYRELARPGEIIRQSVEKLWKFIVGMLATGCTPWRLVITRLGRIGHGELKIWSSMLSKNHLRMTSRQLRESCTQCSHMPSFHETPAIVAACLISTEPETGIRVFSSVFSHDDRFGQVAKQCNVSTPQDASCTHILVFPTSAMASGKQSLPQADMEDDMDFFMGMQADLDAEDIDLANVGELDTTTRTYGAEETCNQQPLAMGYYISTAPAAGLPDWFWSRAPAAKNRCPAHVRACLHIHTRGVQEREEDLLAHASNQNTATHPLDSPLTCDVLRYVLETFNALSWLKLDMSTGDRLSCLPVHMQALLRLYHATEALITSNPL